MATTYKNYPPKFHHGISGWIKHPQGWEYKVAYLSPKRTLSYSMMLEARWTKGKKRIKIPVHRL